MTLDRPLAYGVGLYLLAAAADGALTLAGTGGDPALEGNAFIAAAMTRFGAPLGLFLMKTAAGAACFLLATAGRDAMRRRDAWLDRVPSSPWARAWVRSGDRSWTALAPLYGVALAQLAGAASWAALLR